MVALAGLVGILDTLEHTVCVHQDLLASETNRWLASVFVNSPYWGKAAGFGSLAYFLGQRYFFGAGTSAQNGTVGTILFQGVDADLYSVHNSTRPGPGTNQICNSPYAMEFSSAHYYGVGSDSVPIASNLTDSRESQNISIFHLPTDLSSVVYFNNSFTSSNRAEISTCGGGTQAIQVRSNHLTLGIPFSVENRTVTIPYTFPVSENCTY
ncbi:MAG: hypothetical protein WBG19_06015 [Thermoplasmata archaeon]